MKNRLFLLTLVASFLFSVVGCASISSCFFNFFSSSDTVKITYECPPAYEIPEGSRVSLFRFESDFNDTSDSGHLVNNLGDGFF